ncbi:hypothetical protein BC938DRAFT_482578, partial [Jimgerdemannia flammicorona]
MGLNLNINRIVFDTLQKFDGQIYRDISAPQLKQIAGRAGRFGSYYSEGELWSSLFVAENRSRFMRDSPDALTYSVYLKQAMTTPVKDLEVCVLYGGVELMGNRWGYRDLALIFVSLDM